MERNMGVNGPPRIIEVIPKNTNVVRLSQEDDDEETYDNVFYSAEVEGPHETQVEPAIDNFSDEDDFPDQFHAAIDPNSLRDQYMYNEFESNLVGRMQDASSILKMATLRPKSPKPGNQGKTDKEESIWDKIGTLGRKKRIKEVQEVQAEGRHAIDSPGNPTAPIIPPEEYELDDNEERCMLEPRAYDDQKFIHLIKVLIDWINDELASQRIIVQDLAEDLYDGQVLQKLLEKLTGDKLDVREVTQSEEGQRQKLNAVLSHFNYVLGMHRTGSKKWNVEAIHSKNIVSIMHLLVALARHFRPPVRLTEQVSVPVVIVQKVNGVLVHRTVNEIITTAYDDVGMRCERDAFDTLFDQAPEDIIKVKKSLVTFVNKHLVKINLEVTELETQFHDGVYLTLLMGLLEGFFVPLHSFYLTPGDFDQKVHNVSFAFELMEEMGFTKLKARPEDIVNQDLKSTLRILYNLFCKYK
ncbi:PREDICTED: beta-parvin [Nicrophorus vespilloides]|uniref:Beta-parvin n=1 Tax=Nicrophorus vespilloides TaxID=110193 RepID=A0ABM1NHH7_NICVS|nr:PREDICTED: beta-parvin [Nicrophorus vespilloides]